MIKDGGLEESPPFLFSVCFYMALYGLCSCVVSAGTYLIIFDFRFVMRKTPLEDRLTTIIEPVVTDLGFDLVWIHITGDNGSKNVQITAQDPDTRNLGVDDAAKISRAISAVLDVEDPIEGRYRLEVSSPGIDRMLLNKEDFEYYKGFEAKLEIMTPMENGQKRFRGVIQGIDGDSISLLTDKGDVDLPYSDLAKAKLVLTDKLIKAAANF